MLDHGFAPHISMAEIVKTLGPGGIAKLIHFENEAEAEIYKGFHQWNITSLVQRPWSLANLKHTRRLDSAPFDRGGRFGVMNIITATVRKL
ncbi:hypothetical protein EV130_11192 [Rhizobium azibense]|uniref:Uncharacterized protein n=1 Tax=Rhizobium azibense TaxID=1136135 RepID=A0A4V6P0Y6_9HYPH|nr:hypothetical protein [Rhizobium azibense]TCU21235.1 hypothetical protein EV130_11192 [Rhizobium azibense]